MSADTPEGAERSPAWKATRRIGVGVVGGSLVAVGVPLLVLPGPGLLFIGGGLAVLATEFPSARRSLDRLRRPPARPDEDDG